MVDSSQSFSQKNMFMTTKIENRLVTPKKVIVLLVIFHNLATDWNFLSRFAKNHTRSLMSEVAPEEII
jgi:hypothetical protein